VRNKGGERVHAGAGKKNLRKRANLTETSRCSSKEPWKSQKEFWDEHAGAGEKKTKKLPRNEMRGGQKIWG